MPAILFGRKCTKQLRNTATFSSTALCWERVKPSNPLLTTLNTSRKILRRIYFLSYVYRVTGEDKYAQRAKKELLAACKSDDWNPPHFLDAAETTTAVAIGYDWLYDKFSADERS
ncbi:MAG: hypothetical protein WDO15_25280 [Bacteroidota bacterium]